MIIKIFDWICDRVLGEPEPIPLEEIEKILEINYAFRKSVVEIISIKKRMGLDVSDLENTIRSIDEYGYYYEEKKKEHQESWQSGNASGC